MASIIVKKDGKKFGMNNVVFTDAELDRLVGDGHTYVTVNVVTRRRRVINGHKTNNRAGKKRPLSRAKANVAARRRRKERRYALSLAGTKAGGMGTATFQSRRQAVKYAAEIGANPKSIKRNY